MRICTKCLVSKDLSEFPRSKYQKDGLHHWCRSCLRISYLARRDRRRNQIVDNSNKSNWRMDNFAKQISQIRESLGSTKKDFGILYGVGPERVRAWEQGKSVPTQVTLKRLCSDYNLQLPLSLQVASDGHLPVAVLRCEICEKPFPAYKRGVVTCSKECGHKKIGKSQTGALSHSWGGGRYKLKDGYIRCKIGRDHPYADSNGYIMEHRLVMEKTIGRPLEPHEWVHHKDGVRSHNHPDNLEIWVRVGKGNKKDPSGQRLFDLLNVVADRLTYLGINRGLALETLLEVFRVPNLNNGLMIACENNLD